ncbi:SDR family NAD(P)-dependent oxidoreductase [Specibacter cremeus]|uniref:SDR family NAD(P)-dependent oxidoreductase n=1 Tax=Specibacter cremeus TaxID=1629051 RepID=UPI00197C6EA3|nr:SDR family oxidoreductase [Specibacter cremeus]
MAAEGATVVAGDINETAAKEAAAALGNGSVGTLVDVTGRDSVDALGRGARAAFGRIDVLVNDAGWDKVEPFLQS